MTQHHGLWNTIRNNDEKIANWVSIIVSPHIVGTILIASVALVYSDGQVGQTLSWLALLLPLIVLPPLAFVMLLVRMGKLEDIFMPDRRSRLMPLAVLLVWMLLMYWLIRYWRAPEIVEIFVLAAVILTAALSLVTLVWKISFHAATITAAATTLIMLGWVYTWPLIALVPLVGWSRVRLKRHTLQQVIWGSVVGAIVAVILGQIITVQYS